MEPENVITVNEFSSLLQTCNGDIRIIDLRNPHEIEEKGKLDTSVNIPFGDFDSALALTDNEFEAKYHMKKPAKDDSNLILHCQLGGRSDKGVVVAKNHGYVCPKSLKGGFAAWSEAN